jgi:hypothetical protein
MSVCRQTDFGRLSKVDVCVTTKCAEKSIPWCRARPCSSPHAGINRDPQCGGSFQAAAEGETLLSAIHGEHLSQPSADLRGTGKDALDMDDSPDPLSSCRDMDEMNDNTSSDIMDPGTGLDLQPTAEALGEGTSPAVECGTGLETGT